MKTKKTEPSGEPLEERSERLQTMGSAGDSPTLPGESPDGTGQWPARPTTELPHTRTVVPPEERYIFRLFVAGASARSARAIRNIKALCESRLVGRYELKVIDIYQDPNKATEDQIITAPTLIKVVPLPVRRLIGDLSDEARLLAGLDLPPTGDDSRTVLACAHASVHSGVTGSSQNCLEAER